MIKTMPYSLYKKGYDMFPADNYNRQKKTIEVEIPEHKRPRFPSDWVRSCNHYLTPNGCDVMVWNTGLAENFLVERGGRGPYAKDSKRIGPGLYSREEVIEYVNSFN